MSFFCMCVHCGQSCSFEPPENVPRKKMAWRLHSCESCGRESIDKCSQLAPISYTIGAFIELKRYDEPLLLAQILEAIDLSRCGEEEAKAALEFLGRSEEE